MTVGDGVPLAAFLATDYVVIDGAREVVVRIGQASGELDALLARHGAGHGVFVTGWNPLSRQESPGVNAAANARLEERLAAAGVRALPHVGRAGEWAEEGFFALDLERGEALALAEAFDQYALVVAARGTPAELVLTRHAERADTPR